MLDKTCHDILTPSDVNRLAYYFTRGEKQATIRDRLFSFALNCIRSTGAATVENAVALKELLTSEGFIQNASQGGGLDHAFDMIEDKVFVLTGKRDLGVRRDMGVECIQRHQHDATPEFHQA